MIKFPIKKLTLGLALLLSTNLMGLSPALAQMTGHEEFIYQLDKKIELLKLDVPDTVINQINDIVLEIVEIDPSFGEVTTGGINPNSEVYKSSQLKLERIFELLQPFIEEAQKSYPDAPPFVYVDIPNLTAEQQAQHLVSLYIEEYENYGEPISSDDIQKLENAIREHRIVAENLIDIRSQKDDVAKHSRKYKELLDRLSYLNEQRRLILRPYKNAYKNKQRLRENALISLQPLSKRKRSALAKDEKLDRLFERKYGSFERYGILMSYSDERQVKNLMRERLGLIKEDSRLRSIGFNDTRSSREVEEYNNRLNKLSRLIHEITKPYYERREELKLRTGFE